jgi:hypothetical protein
MSLKYINSKITAPSDIYKWGGCFSENGFYLIVETTGSEDIHAANLGKELFNILLTAYTNQKEKNLAAVQNILKEIKSKEHVASVIISLIEGNAIYLSSFGKSEVVLKRDGKYGKILGSDDCSSGQLKEGDRLLFSSSTFSEFISWEIKKNLFSIEDPDLYVETVAPFILNNEKAYGSAALMVSVESEKELGNSKIFVSEDKKGWQKKIQGIFENSKFSFNKLFDRRFENNEESKSKKTLLTISIILILLLVISIFLNLKSNSSTHRQAKLNGITELVNHQYDEAINLIDLNPVRARSLLSTARLSLMPLLSDFPKDSLEYKKVEEWIGKISEEEVQAYKIFKLTAVPLFFDIGLIKSGGEGQKAATFEDVSIILDMTNRALYSLSLSTKQAKILAGSESIKDAQNISVHGTNAYIFNSEGIIQIDLESKAVKQIIKPDPEWGEIKAIAAFGGNIYLLDQKNNTIWKYIATDFGFSQKTKYLNPDVRADFSGSLELEVDGAVWVVKMGELQKFSKGLGEAFAFKGFSDSVSGFSTASITDLNKNIYILDKNISRILVFSKDGEYQSQYQWDELKNANDILASEPQKKIFVFVGSKVYGIEIK